MRGRTRDEVPVRDHRSLRVAGRPAGEHDLGEVVRPDRRRRQRLRPAGVIGQRLDPDDRQTERAGASAVWRLASTSVASVWAATLAANSFVWRASSGTDDRAGVGDGEEGDPPLGPVDGPEDHPIAGLRAGVGEDPAARGTIAAEVAIPPHAGPERRSDQEGRASGVPVNGRRPRGRSGAPSSRSRSASAFSRHPVGAPDRPADERAVGDRPATACIVPEDDHRRRLGSRCVRTLARAAPDVVAEEPTCERHLASPRPRACHQRTGVRRARRTGRRCPACDPACG